MRLLYFDNEQVDIDNNTAIGIDLQAYDLTTLQRRVNVSNRFSLPRTAKNMRIIGHAGNVQSESKKIYNDFSSQYWINSVRFINGRAFVENVDERINCFVYDNNSLWSELKNYSFLEFQTEYVNWLHDKGFPSQESTSTFSEFIEMLNDYVYIPYYKTKVDTTENIVLSSELENGGHFAAKLTSIFLFIEEFFNVDFGVSKTFDFNLFQDVVFKKMHVPLMNIELFGTADECFLDLSTNRIGEDYYKDFAQDKTLYNFVSDIFKYFNAIIDNGKVYRFDDIDNAEIKELSGIQSGFKFFPYIENYTQQNYIKFDNIYEGGSEYLNSKKIVCKNKNIESKETTIHIIDSYIGSVISELLPYADLSSEESKQTYAILIEDETKTVSISWGGTSASLNIPCSKYYDLNSEYIKLSEIAEYPKVYEIKKYFSLSEVNNLSFFKRYFVRELNGYFYINKIKGFNPEKSTDPVTVTLIKI